MADLSALHVLAENLKKLMAANEPLNSQGKLGKKAVVDQTLIGRVLREGSHPRLDNIQAIAKAFKLQVWQLLYPGLTPGRPPQKLPELSNKALELAKAYDRIADPDQQRRAYAIVKNAVEIAGATSPTAPPVVPIEEQAPSR